MTERTHPALEALKKIRDITGSTGGHKAMVAEFKHLAGLAIPALEALLAERDAARRALIGLAPPKSTMDGLPCFCGAWKEPGPGAHSDPCMNARDVLGGP